MSSTLDLYPYANRPSRGSGASCSAQVAVGLQRLQPVQTERNLRERRLPTLRDCLQVKQLPARAPGCSTTTSPRPTGLTWSPARRSAMGEPDLGWLRRHGAAPPERSGPPKETGWAPTTRLTTRPRS